MDNQVFKKQKKLKKAGTLSRGCHRLQAPADLGARPGERRARRARRQHRRRGWGWGWQRLGSWSPEDKHIYIYII